MWSSQRQLHLHARVEGTPLRSSLSQKLLRTIVFAQVSGAHSWLKVWLYQINQLIGYFHFLLVVQESSLLRSCFRSLFLSTRLERPTVIKRQTTIWLDNIINLSLSLSLSLATNNCHCLILWRQRCHHLDAMNRVLTELTARIAPRVADVRMAALAVPSMANVSAPTDGRYNHFVPLNLFSITH